MPFYTFYKYVLFTANNKLETLFLHICKIGFNEVEIL